MNLHQLRRYDQAIDRSLREMEAHAVQTPPLTRPSFEDAAKESDEAAQDTVEGLTALAIYVAIVMACVVMVVA